MKKINQTYAGKVKAEQKAKMSLPNWQPSKPKAWTPQKGIPDQSKINNSGFGWGGEKPNSVSIKTNSKMNKNGEIINPTKSDIANYNKKYQTIRYKK